MARYYRVDLADLWRGTLTPRRCAVLVSQLPADSALTRDVAGHSWTLGDQLLAVVADRVAVANWQRTKDGQSGRNPPRPLPRPWDEPEGIVIGRGSWSIDEMRQKLAEWPGRQRNRGEVISGD